MTPAEIRDIARQRDPDIMAEALLLIADDVGDDDVYARIRGAIRMPPLSARLLALLWRHRGQIVPYERIEDRLDICGREIVRTVKLRLVRALDGLPVEIQAHHRDGYSLHVSGAVPWDEVRRLPE